MIAQSAFFIFKKLIFLHLFMKEVSVIWKKLQVL